MLKKLLLFIGLVNISLIAIMGVFPSTYASFRENCPDGFEVTFTQPSQYGDKCSNHQSGTSQADDQEASTSPKPTGANYQGECSPGSGVALDKTNCGILAYLLTGINLLSGLVGLVVVIMIAIGGIQYTTARDNPQAVAAAKARITNAIIALVASLFIYAFLQYIVPGGVL